MKRLYRVVVFDWEGTLAEDLVGQVLHLLTDEARRFHLGGFSHTNARDALAHGLPKAIHKLFPQLNSHQQEALLESLHKAVSMSSFDVCLMPGAKALVKALFQQGVHLAIASNKGHASLMRLLQASGLDDYIKVVRCAGQLPAKPSPEMLVEILEEFGVTASEALMVGDSLADIEMARALSVDAVGMDVYHENSQALRKAGALDVFDRFASLATFLQLKELDDEDLDGLA